MGFCVAYGCNNGAKKKKPGVTFHRFPKDLELRHKWKLAVRRENWEPNFYSCVCSEHFTENVIDRTSVSCVRLRQGAVPSIFPAFPKHLQKKLHTRKPPAKRRRVELPNPTENIVPHAVAPELDKEQSGSDSIEIEAVTNKVTVDAAVQTTLQLDCNKVYVHLGPNCEENTEPQVSFDTPRKATLKRQLESVTDKYKNTKTKLKILQQRCRRQNKKSRCT